MYKNLNTDSNPAFVNVLLHGKKNVLVARAFKLEKMLEVNASFWLNAQYNYNQTLTYQKAKRNLNNGGYLLPAMLNCCGL